VRVVAVPLGRADQPALFRLAGFARYRDPDRRDTGRRRWRDKASTHARIVRKRQGWGNLLCRLPRRVLFTAFGLPQDPVRTRILRPYVTSLAGVGVSWRLHGFSADCVRAINRGRDRLPAKALMPVALRLILLNAAARPRWRWFWGARVADLTELWAASARIYRRGKAVSRHRTCWRLPSFSAIGYLLHAFAAMAPCGATVLPKTKN